MGDANNFEGFCVPLLKVILEVENTVTVLPPFLNRFFKDHSKEIEILV